MRVTKPIIVLVGAYSTGSYLPYQFIANGYQCIHVSPAVQMSKNIKHKFKTHEKNYIEIISMADDSSQEIQKVVNQLKKYNIKAIIAGSEPFVVLTDKISSRFPVLKNQAATSMLRRHKYYMIEALKEAGLKIQKQFISSNIEEIIRWYKNSNLNKVILKPPLSAASDMYLYVTVKIRLEVILIKSIFVKTYLVTAIMK